MKTVTAAPGFAATMLLLSGAAVVAAPKPMTLAPVYSDSIGSELDISKKTPICAVTVTGLVDNRRSPEMIGVFSGRAIHAPEDRDTWLKSLIAALKSRKIDVRFADASSAEVGGIAAEIALNKAWIANTNSNMSASVVFQLKATTPAGQALDLPYRGGGSHINWASGFGELQRVMDVAIARSLDAMAADLHKLCDSGM
jgi:hypothetical protein